MGTPLANGQGLAPELRVEGSGLERARKAPKEVLRPEFEDVIFLRGVQAEVDELDLADRLSRPAEDGPAFERPLDLKEEKIAGRLERGVEDARPRAADLGADAAEPAGA